MPRTPADYSKTIIYKLCCKDVAITEIYVGHTTNFRDRKRTHKKSCNKETCKEYNRYKYQFIRANGGFENWAMIQLEAYPCETKRDAEARERYWVETLAAKLNSIIPFRTKDEDLDYQKKYHRQYDKQYGVLNKDKIKEKNRQYSELNKTHKQEYNKQYYLNKKCSDNV